MILAIVAPSRGVDAGLILVIVIWAVVLGMDFPTGKIRGTFNRDVGPSGPARTDFGGEAAKDYERRHPDRQ